MDVRILPHLLSSVMSLYLGHSVCGSSIFIMNFEPVFPPTECAICAKLTLKSSETRSSRPDVFCKKGVLKNFRKLTGKHLCQSLFFNKFEGLRPTTLLKKTLAKVFLCEFCETSKNTSFYRTPLVAAFAWARLYRTNFECSLDCPLGICLDCGKALSFISTNSFTLMIKSITFGSKLPIKTPK